MEGCVGGCQTEQPSSPAPLRSSTKRHTACNGARMIDGTRWISEIGVLLASGSVASASLAQMTDPPTRSFPPVEAPAAVPPASPSTAPPPPAGVPPPAVFAPYPAPMDFRPRDPARARPKDRWRDRDMLIEGHLGIGTPYGTLGIALEIDAIEYFGFVVGGGAGAAGPQIATGFRARAPLGFVALGGELTWSGGPYESTDCHLYCFRDRGVARWDFAHWINVSPAIELRTGSGFSARFYAGAGKLLNPGDGECIGDIHCRSTDPLAFAGFALGAAF